jgi:hypothetical protein
MAFKGIQKSLEVGCRLHGFLSGGGLRVIRIEKDGKLRGYGEHPNVEGALQHADEDYLAGGRPYNQVYGGLKLHYLTGTSMASSVLDQWFLAGRTIDALKKDDLILVELIGRGQTKIPDWVFEEVSKTKEAVIWKHRNYTYQSDSSIFLNGKFCVSTSVIGGVIKNGADPWFYPVKKTGFAKDFSSALDLAILAEEIEVDSK